MDSRKQNYSNPHLLSNQHQVLPSSMVDRNRYSSSPSHNNNAMQSQEGLQNGFKTPLSSSNSIARPAPLMNPSMPSKAGNVGYPQTPLNLNNPPHTGNRAMSEPISKISSNIYNGIHQKHNQSNVYGGRIMQSGHPTTNQSPNQHSNLIVPAVSAHATPLSQVSSPYPTQPKSSQQISVSQPRITTSLQQNNVYSSSTQPGNALDPSNHSNQESNMVPGAVSGKRRLYPHQVAPSIPTTNFQGGNQVSLNDNSSTQQHGALIQSSHKAVNQQPHNISEVNNMMGRLSVEQSPTHPVNLLEQKQIVAALNHPLKPHTSQDIRKKSVHPDVMRCTFNAVPQTSSLLKQSKLPFGIYVHPFKQDIDLPVVSSVITRCRSCRSYLNPFVSILDHKRWQCNMCYRINDIPEELIFDYSTRQYTDIRKRPELTSASIEFIAPSEYMLRPPQPSVYLFAFDVSFNAISTGYLQHSCQVIAENIGNLPGDLRMMIGFLTFNSSIHFYSLKSSQSQPQMFIVTDLEDLFLPAMDGLLVNVKENKEMILELLESLPNTFSKETDTGSATGAAMVAARKMVASVGGRITVFQTCIPSVGPGKLSQRESSGKSPSSKDIQNLNPSTDFYKKLALECAGEQIAIDVFLLAGQYTDLASLSCASRYSSGSLFYFPEFHGSKNKPMIEKFRHDFKRYLTKNIGFEAVMRLRCTKGINIHTFHGNFFVRSTDLLSLPNVNPDHSFFMQIDIEDSLTESSTVAFQAALLYTTTKGERRIRVHTLSLPVTSKITDVYAYADQDAIISALSKLAVDRTLMSSLGDARDALMNACMDFLKVYRKDVCDQRSISGGLLAPHQLRVIPLYVLGLLKNDAFKLGGGVSLDSRMFSLLEYKWQPILTASLKIYPKLYSVSQLLLDSNPVADPPVLHATAEKLSRQKMYLMDAGNIIFLFVGRNVPDDEIQKVFDVSNVAAISENYHELPTLENPLSVALRKLIDHLRSQRPLYAILSVIREDMKERLIFLSKLIDDRTESSMSYHEFLQHIQRQISG